MRVFRWMGWLVGLFLLTTCCPSITLTVTKIPPAPRPTVSAPGVQTDAIPLPYRFENRFDLHTRKPSVEAKSFSDYYNGSDPGARAFVARAVATRSALLQDLGGGGVAYEPIGGAPDAATYHDLGAGTTLRAHIKTSARVDPRALLVRVDASGKTHYRSIIRPPECGEASCELVLDSHIEALSKSKTTQAGIEVTVGVAAQPALARPLLSFVHMSDVQLRDSRVKLGGPEFSRRMDQLIGSFEHDELQEFYGRYVFEAVVRTINGFVARPDARRGARVGARAAPTFLVHTGDAIDVGLVSEMQEFHRIMDTLAVPWFDAVGNHDILVYGNLLPGGDDECVSVLSVVEGASEAWAAKRAVRWLVPNKLCVAPKIKAPGGSSAAKETFLASAPNPLDAFIKGHEHAPWAYLPQLRGGLDTYSRSHGFDRTVPSDCIEKRARRKKDKRCSYAAVAKHRRGYYYFRTKVPVLRDRYAVFIVLNTDELPKKVGGKAGWLSKEQLDWLQHLLEQVGGRDLVFLFGHHAPYAVLQKGNRARFEDLLNTHQKKIVGFFYGHHHKHGLCRSKKNWRCTKYWEVETGSVLEFPHEPRLVTLKYVGDGLAYLEVQPFGERLRRSGHNQFVDYVNRGKRGAIRDYCAHKGTCLHGEPRRTDHDHGAARLFFQLR